MIGRITKILDFTRDEWIAAFSFDQSESEAVARPNEMFQGANERGSDDVALDGHGMLRLGYVNSDCRARIIMLLTSNGPFGGRLLESLRKLDAETRASGTLRHPPRSEPL